MERFLIYYFRYSIIPNILAKLTNPKTQTLLVSIKIEFIISHVSLNKTYKHITIIPNFPKFTFCFTFKTCLKMLIAYIASVIIFFGSSFMTIYDFVLSFRISKVMFFVFLHSVCLADNPCSVLYTSQNSSEKCNY